MIFFSATTRGFYDTDINTEIPADAVEIAIEERDALLAAQAAGQIITTDAFGRPEATAPAAPPLAEFKDELCARVDAIASQVYDLIGSASPGRLAEYQQAETEATAFKAAGYAGEAPPTVACWSQAQGWTDQQACDDILATAAAWRGALVAIRTARLIGKANVSAAQDVDAAQAAASAAIASIRAVPAGL